ncbi:MAG: histidine kinase [Vicingaceae bacterium]
MHFFTLNRQRLYWICQISGWGVYIFLIALFNRLNGNDFGLRFSFNLLSTFILGIAVSHSYRFFIIRWNWLQLKIIQLLPRVLLASFVLAFAYYSLHTFVSEYIISSNGYDFDGFALLQNLLNLSANFLLWTLFYWSFHFIQNFRKEEIKNLKWQATIREMELNKIKSQLNPHFIFNCMNSIRAMVDEEPEKAKNLINQFSNILRSSLYMEKKPLISFEDELSLVKDYLGLEKARLEERLNLEIEIDDNCNQFRVPPLLVQTLAENGIKHGIALLEKGGTLKIQGKVKNEILHLSIVNSGKFQSKENGKQGIGLDISRQRLKLLYGDSAELEIIEKEGNVYANLILPKYSNKLEHESIDR